MTRKSKREIEDVVERLKSQIGTDDAGGDDGLTIDDKAIEHLETVLTDLEGLTGTKREHYENLGEWLAEEPPTNTNRTGHELTPPEMVLLDLLTIPQDQPFHGPTQYYERFPDAPCPGFGEEYA